MTETKTDYERFKELFDSVGQEYELFNIDKNQFIQVNGGYSCFYTCIEFTEDGKFIEMGAGE